MTTGAGDSRAEMRSPCRRLSRHNQDRYEEPMRPRGIVSLYESGRLLWEETNLFVNTGLPLLANLIAGITANQYVTAIGFGSSATPPSVSDTALGGTPAYYKAIGASS